MFTTRFEAWVRRHAEALMKALGRLPVTPNQITVVGTLLTFVAAVLTAAAQLSVRRLSRFHARPLFGRRDVPRIGRLFRKLWWAAPALVAPGDGRRARGLFPGELCARAGTKPGVHLRDGIVRAA